MDNVYTTLDHTLEVAFRVGLWIFFLWMDKLPPFIRHIDEEELWYYRYPSVDSYIPKIYLYALIFGVPLIIFFLQYIFHRKEKLIIVDILNNLYGLTLAIVLNAIFTSTLKLLIGRPRPNFFLRCFPDGIGTNIESCTGEYRGYMDGRKSFPSAHSSFAFTAMTYMTLHSFNIHNIKKPRFAKGILVFISTLPMFLATVIGISRTCDYHHHYSDVFGGAVLGATIAIIVHYFYSTMDKESEDKLLEALKKLKLE